MFLSMFQTPSMEIWSNGLRWSGLSMDVEVPVPGIFLFYYYLMDMQQQTVRLVKRYAAIL
jgi:hypothetical protein